MISLSKNSFFWYPTTRTMVEKQGKFMLLCLELAENKIKGKENGGGKWGWAKLVGWWSVGLYLNFQATELLAISSNNLLFGLKFRISHFRLAQRVEISPRP